MKILGIVLIVFGVGVILGGISEANIALAIVGVIFTILGILSMVLNKKLTKDGKMKLWGIISSVFGGFLVIAGIVTNERTKNDMRLFMKYGAESGNSIITVGIIILAVGVLLLALRYLKLNKKSED